MTTRADHTMLVCIRSFGYYDPLSGGQTCIKGRAYAAPGSYVVGRFPENFARSERCSVTRDSAPIPDITIRSR